MVGRKGKISVILLITIMLSVVSKTISRDTEESPTFSNPTVITNQFFPLSTIDHTISLGQKENTTLRIEVTPLHQTRIIEWGGGQIESIVTQFVEYTDGRLVEVAYDYFAQSDEGSVYYLGEDVTNYKNGEITDHEGSWLVGRDGARPALIMPAKPQVGQVFNSENLPGIVFETDKVLSLTQETTVPSGYITDGLLVEETLMDGRVEYKIYAAGFGIVEERDGDGRVNLVQFMKSDSAPSVVPDSLQTIEAQLEDIIDIAPSQSWTQITNDASVITKAWQAYKSSTTEHSIPQTFYDVFTDDLTHLQNALVTKNVEATMQSANNLSAGVVDLFDVYNPAIPVDLGWLDVLGRQTVFDTTANDLSAAANDLAKTNAIWARLRTSVLSHNGTKVALEFEANLYSQRVALVARKSSDLLEQATNGLEIVDALEQLY